MVDIYTSGYSTRTLEAWTRMVKKHGIEMLVDVRTLGKTKNSTNKPEFSKESLIDSLPKLGLRYHMIPKLGGYRHFSDTGITKQDSPNLGLNKENGFSSDAFRRYADYTYANQDFMEGVTELLDLANNYKIAAFCCEGWHRKCHRNLLANYLTVFNLANVYHITSGIRVEKHEPMSLGVVRDGKLIYPLCC